MLSEYPFSVFGIHSNCLPISTLCQRIYESLVKSKVLNEGRANIFISTILENSKKFNRKALKKQKYNLINEIKKHYNLESFFGSKISNYKQIAAIYTLIESYNCKEVTDLDQINSNKITLLEFLTKSEIKKEDKDKVLKEFSSYDKDLRQLTYRVLLEKFNEKYDGLSAEQKEILKEFIYSVDSTPSLREFYSVQLISSKMDSTMSFACNSPPSSEKKEVTTSILVIHSTIKSL